MCGTGAMLQALLPAFREALSSRGIGLEVADTVGSGSCAGMAFQTGSHAEWRVFPILVAHPSSQVNAIATFNIIAQEGRHVAGVFQPVGADSQET